MVFFLNISNMGMDIAFVSGPEYILNNFIFKNTKAVRKSRVLHIFYMKKGSDYDC